MEGARSVAAAAGAGKNKNVQTTQQYDKQATTVNKNCIYLQTDIIKAEAKKNNRTKNK